MYTCRGEVGRPAAKASRAASGAEPRPAGSMA